MEEKGGEGRGGSWGGRKEREEREGRGGRFIYFEDFEIGTAHIFWTLLFKSFLRDFLGMLKIR